MAGILVGSGSHSPDGRMAGVAPQASLISVRVLDGTGRGLTSDVLAGLQWILDNKTQYGSGVVNLSLGHSDLRARPRWTRSSRPWMRSVDAGVVVVCSAGNNGRDGYVTISSPCNSRKVITGRRDQRPPHGRRLDDTTTTYSSHGPTAIDLVAKPDLVAPGNRIVSLRSAGSYQDTALPGPARGRRPAEPGVLEYFEMSGSSMASRSSRAPAALMLEQDPSLNPGTIKARLMMSARKPAVRRSSGHRRRLPRHPRPPCAPPGPRPTRRRPAAIIDAQSGLDRVREHGRPLGQRSVLAAWPPGGELRDLADPDRLLPVASSDGGRDSGRAARCGRRARLWPESEFWPEGEMWPDLAEAWSAIRNTSDGLPIEITPLAVGIQDP